MLGGFSAKQMNENNFLKKSIQMRGNTNNTY